MKIRQRTVAKLPRGYSIALLPTRDDNALPAFLAGSEGDAELLLFEPPAFEPKIIAREPGGYISVATFVRDGRRFAVASTEFKPGFDAAESAIHLYPLDEGEFPRPTLLAVLPYTHRVATLQHAGRDWLLASTLCAAKANKEDWTQPGGIHLAEIPDPPAQPWTLRQIVTGLNKNHGFDFARTRSRAASRVSALRDGRLFFLPIPAEPDGAWPSERLDSREHSDAFAFDWDGDGEPEIFSISPFHGHVLSCTTQREWLDRNVIHDDLAFGHIVWAGDFLGAPGCSPAAGASGANCGCIGPTPRRRESSEIRTDRRGNRSRRKSPWSRKDHGCDIVRRGARSGRGANLRDRGVTAAHPPRVRVSSSR